MKPYEPFDHTADVGLRVRGDSLPQLFENAALGLFDTIVGLDHIAPRDERAIEIDACDLEELMVNWLSELLYRFEVDGQVFAEFSVQALSPERLEATVRGEPFDLDRYPVAADIKAVTYHQLKVEQRDGQWQVSIVFDV